MKLIRKELSKRYDKYVNALLANNVPQAIRYATDYNHFLRISGGPAAIQTERYLSMGADQASED
jgi:hypothetical protein